jgi:hypothetical protein
MRLALLAAICAAALSVLGNASAAERARLPNYCSPSGDVCYGIFKASGQYSFRLTLAAKYFSRYRLCVRRLGQARQCKRLPVKKTGAQWGGRVNWFRNFSHAPGSYRVTWWHGTNRLGPPLNLTLPSPSS